MGIGAIGITGVKLPKIKFGYFFYLFRISYAYMPPRRHPAGSRRGEEADGLFKYSANCVGVNVNSARENVFAVYTLSIVV